MRHPVPSESAAPAQRLCSFVRHTFQFSLEILDTELNKTSENKEDLINFFQHCTRNARTLCDGVKGSKRIRTVPHSMAGYSMAGYFQGFKNAPGTHEKTTSQMNMSIPSVRFLKAVIYCRRVCKNCPSPNIGLCSRRRIFDFRPHLIFHQIVHGNDFTHAAQVSNTLIIVRLFWTCSCKKHFSCSTCCDVSLGSGRGRKTMSVTTIHPVPASKHPEMVTLRKRKANPDRSTVRVHDPALVLAADHHANDITEL